MSDRKTVDLLNRNRTEFTPPGVISRGNAVPIVKVFKKALLTALRTIYRPKCTRLQDRILHIQSLNFSGGHITDPTEAPPVLGPRHQFPLGLPAFPLFLFYETTTAPRRHYGLQNFQISIWVDYKIQGVPQERV